jgi:hypothetical protein
MDCNATATTGDRGTKTDNATETLNTLNLVYGGKAGIGDVRRHSALEALKREIYRVEVIARPYLPAKKILMNFDKYILVKNIYELDNGESELADPNGPMTEETVGAIKFASELCGASILEIRADLTELAQENEAADSASAMAGASITRWLLPCAVRVGEDSYPAELNP